MKKTLLYLSISSILIIGSYLCILPPDQFTPNLLVQKITHHFPSSDCKELEEIVSQPLSYLGKGSQAIVFESADGRYVLKFFLTERYHTKIRIRRPFRTIAPARIRWDVLERYATAFERLKEETGLIAIHLSANTHSLPQCVLKDPQGHTHTIDLNLFSFVVQKKCDCIAQKFHKMSPQKQSIVADALEQLMTTIATKGFYNLRSSFKDENFAMLGDQAIMIDIGNVIFNEAQILYPQPEIERAHSLLHTWLKKAS